MKEFQSSPLTDTGDRDCFVVVRLNSVLGKVLQEIKNEHYDFDNAGTLLSNHEISVNLFAYHSTGLLFVPLLLYCPALLVYCTF